MNYQKYQIEFRSKAEEAGYSDELIQKCLTYAEKLIIRGVPVIYSSAHLSALVGYKRSYIKRATYGTKSFYRGFKVEKKKKGTFREIWEPLPSLKEIQSWILRNILDIYKHNKYSKAYITKRTILDNVKYHRKQKIVLSMDIEDFFGSIKINKVQSIFENYGYSQRVASVLAKLCCLNESLPQGAPTSPTLSNIFMAEFDTIISSYCKSENIKYTRYADDLTFSGNFDCESLEELVKNELIKIDLTLNSNKTRVMKRHQRQIVTGIIVNNEKLQTPIEVRKELRQAVYYIKEYGLASHLDFIKCTKANYLKHLLGKVNYVLFINPKDEQALKQKDFLLTLL